MNESASITWLHEPNFKLISNDGNWDKFVCITAGQVRISDELIEFPLGWITDVTSSPWWARSFLSQLGSHTPAALLHDRLLDLGYERSLARYWMSTQLGDLEKVSRIKRWRMVAGVWLNDQILKIIK